MSASRIASAPVFWKRSERKYWLSESMAGNVRGFIEPFMTADPMNFAMSSKGQRITSLYLDTPNSDFYERHVSFAADRFKLRVRYYGEEPKDIAYFEVKRKVGHVIDKCRARVPVADVVALLERRPLPQADGDGLEAKHLRWFLYLMMAHRAVPKVLLTCRREAFCSRQPDKTRITFDRGMAYQAVMKPTLTGNPRRWVTTPVRTGGVLLELKYSGAPPWWMRELAQRLSRHGAGYSKYVTAMAVESGDGDSWLDGIKGVPA
jgi:hypothetical protein